MLSKVMDAWSGLVDGFYRNQFGGNERIRLYESMTALLENGVPLDLALDRIGSIYSDGGRHARHPIALASYGIGKAVDGGKTLAQACLNWVPYQEHAVISAGEKSGNLIQAFSDCVRIIEARQKVMKLVVSTASYPIFVWSLMAYLLNVIATRVVPAMSRSSNPEAWSGAPMVLHMIATFVTNWGLLTLCIVVVLVVTSIVTLPYFRGPWRTRLEILPPWSIYKALHGSTFLLNIAVMLRANIDPLGALDTLKRGANPWLRERLEAAHYGVRMGKNFGEALDLSGHKFPDHEAIQFLIVLSTTQSFSAAVHRYSLRWLEISLKQVERYAKTLSLVSMVLIGVLMILVMVGAYSMTGNATQGMTH
ncbi:pilus assembly protein [Pseudomonas syringae]|uniref:Conjugative transfer protein PilR n=1 Tax=Pseudomonas syringae pv. actinidiae TaxID=103796 RepID=A0A2P0QGP6_PSESF|nr:MULTISPECIES: type II secretion system F family protein [Pseudomonas]ARO45571.1 Conjugative transfer protein PilR [Pseudomonas syringae pv. actinidiae]KTC48741.1 pilus assembly protein [Pseudomonas syringae pv. actinidiae ICMP 19497]NAP06161.1 pilus assembly protein [Pseudomonas syringae]NAP23139.1 pilus assembly protein [Pseudomonas syringae]NAP49208.1 pilus assembly protein [Pseudomonas syringae]